MKKYSVAIASALAVLFLASCGSKPAPEPATEPAVQEVPVETPSDDFSAENAKLIALTDAAREKAVLAQAQTYYPEPFAFADQQFESLKKDIADKPAEDYSVRIKDLTSRYESLAAASEAHALKSRVESLGFASLDQSAFDNAGKALSEYDAMGTGAGGADLLAKANEAKEGYKSLINKGFVAAAGRERQAALKAKKDADSVKAGVAQKEVYTKASDTFKKADLAYVTANIEGAYEGYKSSKETFTMLFNTISEKRAAAQAMIDRAKQKVSDSASYAEEADAIAPLAAEVAGIEKEDAVLLEEEQFANPEEAVINVEEGITAKTAEKAAEAAIAVDNAVDQTVTDIKSEVQ